MKAKMFVIGLLALTVLVATAVSDTVITDTLINTTGNLSARGARYDLGASFHMFDTLDMRYSNRVVNIGDASTDFTGTGGLNLADTLNMNLSIIQNIGVAGTDFSATGGLTLADRLTINHATPGIYFNNDNDQTWFLNIDTNDDFYLRDEDNTQTYWIARNGTKHFDLYGDLDMNTRNIVNISTGNTYFNSTGSLEMGSDINTTGYDISLGHGGDIQNVQQILATDSVSDLHIRGPNGGSLTFNYNRDAGFSIRSDKADSSTTSRFTINSGVDIALATFIATNVNMDANYIINIGAAGTDFTDTGGLTLADDLTCNANATVAAGSVLKLTPTDSPPGCDTEGMIYADDSLNMPCYCNSSGGSWVKMTNFVDVC